MQGTKRVGPLLLQCDYEQIQRDILNGKSVRSATKTDIRRQEWLKFRHRMGLPTDAKEIRAAYVAAGGIIDRPVSTEELAAEAAPMIPMSALYEAAAIKAMRYSSEAMSSDEVGGVKWSVLRCALDHIEDSPKWAKTAIDILKYLDADLSAKSSAFTPQAYAEARRKLAAECDSEMMCYEDAQSLGLVEGVNEELKEKEA